MRLCFAPEGFPQAVSDFNKHRNQLSARVFCISAKFLWPSCEPMQLGAWRIATLHFASRTPNRVVFRVAGVAKTRGDCMFRVSLSWHPKRGDELRLGDDESGPNRPVTLSIICLIDKHPIP